MASLADAISQSFADRYDPQKQAISRMLNSEARVNEIRVPGVKLGTAKEIKKERKLARKEKKPDQDYIDFLTGLLGEVKEI